MQLHGDGYSIWNAFQQHMAKDPKYKGKDYHKVIQNKSNREKLERYVQEYYGKSSTNEARPSDPIGLLDQNKQFKSMFDSLEKNVINQSDTHYNNLNGSINNKFSKQSRRSKKYYNSLAKGEVNILEKIYEMSDGNADLAIVMSELDEKIEDLRNNDDIILNISEEIMKINKEILEHLYMTQARFHSYPIS
jgi:hypothetical protein